MHHPTLENETSMKFINLEMCDVACSAGVSGDELCAYIVTGLVYISYDHDLLSQISPSPSN